MLHRSGCAPTASRDWWGPEGQGVSWGPHDADRGIAAQMTWARCAGAAYRFLAAASRGAGLAGGPDAAVDGDDGAGDVGGASAAEEDRDAGHVVGTADAS